MLKFSFRKVTWCLRYLTPSEGLQSSTLACLQQNITWAGSMWTMNSLRPIRSGFAFKWDCCSLPGKGWVFGDLIIADCGFFIYFYGFFFIKFCLSLLLLPSHSICVKSSMRHFPAPLPLEIAKRPRWWASHSLKKGMGGGQCVCLSALQLCYLLSRLTRVK